MAAVCKLLTAGMAVMLGVSVTARVQSADEAAAYDHVQPLLATYCYKCHGGEKKKAGLDLAQFKSSEAAGAAGDVWEMAAERIQNREMPPDGSEQPSDEDRGRLLAWMKGAPKTESECKNLANDSNQHFYRGYVMSRRLNRAEYNNTVRDLFGLDLKPADAFPADGSGGEGFDNTGGALFTSPILMEKYLDAADTVLEAALPEDAGGASKDIQEARQRILVAAPSESLSPRDAARQIVTRFARRAFRRPPGEAEVERLLSMFDKAQARGDSFVASVRLALKAALVSPHFLFLIEPEPPQEGVHELGHYEIASRLSYFLWSSMPDEELLSLAESGQLHEEAVLKQQARRMLKDPRAKALAENFGVQWLGIGALGFTAKPDHGRFPDFDSQLADSMRAEATLYVDAVLREDRSLLDLINGNYTFLNERLARHYGVPNVQGPEMRRVELADAARGGVLGMGAVLTSTSYPLRTSPVLRGKWVLEQVLGGKVPPPPPTAGFLPPDDAQHDGLTFRQRLEQHRSKPECASCHQRMDPLGFGLENFDPIGRWRTEQAGGAVDASGKLPSGEEFRGPVELKNVLMNKKQEFVKNFSRKLLGYALGREVNKFDRCVVDEAAKALEAEEYRPSVLIEQIVVSYPFRYRYSKK